MGSCTWCGALMADDDETCITCGTSRRVASPAVRGESAAGAGTRLFDQFAGPDDAADHGAPAADPPVGLGRRLVYVVAVVLALASITAGAVWASSVWGTERTGTTTTDSSPPGTGPRLAPEPPADAQPLAVTGGPLAGVPPARLSVGDASCTGLRPTVLADECVELSQPGRRHAVTLSQEVDGVRVEAYELVDDADGPAAIMQLGGRITAADLQPGAALVVQAATATTSSGSAFVIASTAEGDGDRPPDGSVEFVAPDGDGVLRTVGHVAEGRATVAADDGRLLVASERYGDDACCVSAVLLTTVYALPDGWVGGMELLDEATAARRIGAADPVEPQATVRIDAPAAVVTVPTVPPAPSTAATVTAPTTTVPTATTATTVPTTPSAPPPSPATTSTAAPRVAPFADLDCDNSWIAVVASRPAAQVADALAENPGARVVKNDESCASLTPRFTSGAYTGEVIHVVFYGPFPDRLAAQNECIARGKPAAGDCYAAVLSPDPADRDTRFGPGS